ncbi:MAG: Formate hydrogenlyase subunit 5 precursor [Planctomycetes bacterium ADurb.Bin126]|nr:MAG: Formate hydrogenlyase subunit 5 precursor [Planctomycetes bacterium ADurb.Bin126]HOD82456.1 NADH-quinone oxidoreductase subunit C [Phycisphaerae bacterium]HQL73013.1 NADH-quinone oxidoreductase subunit C [Phycisphaerae bacterium]
MATDAPVMVRNAQAVDSSAVPALSVDRFRQVVTEEVAGGARLSALLVLAPPRVPRRLLAVIARPLVGNLGLLACDVGDSYPSLTPSCPAAHWFEREIAEQSGVRPEGHPWLKPIRFVAGGPADVGVMDFFRMEGEEIHEVAVGPVHAGVIEPGHFRFQCQGETVHHLEISLGYQHRGVERAMAGGATPRARHYMETLAGDTTVGHMTAYCRAMEALSDARPPARAEALRAIAAELERIANHLGDLGAMAGDVGFLPTMSYCGRIRGDALNLTALLCGNRFGRGMVVVGGVGYDVDAALEDEILVRLDGIEKDAAGAIELMFDTPSVLSRFEGTGIVPEELARRIGMVGLAARASGLPCDVRHEFPYGLYQFTQMPVCTWQSGDCFARAYVRWLEIRQSIVFIREHMRSLPGGPMRQEPRPSQGGRIVASLSEGWRGEICHVALTDADGRLAAYKVVDPSFHNWFGLACALRDQQISDFPLCNKSFNLSYCGHDL